MYSGCSRFHLNRFTFGRGLSVADFERASWRARRIFCQISNARFHRFPIGQILRTLNTTRRSVSRWKLSEQIFENFNVRGCFSKKNAKISSKKLTYCDLLEKRSLLSDWTLYYDVNVLKYMSISLFVYFHLFLQLYFWLLSLDSELTPVGVVTRHGLKAEAIQRNTRC